MSTHTFSDLPSAPGQASAIALYARATASFDGRVAEAVDLLRQAADTGAATQASSLGAEDMVITHLINSHALPIPVFVLETGALHAETLALLDRLRVQQAAHLQAPLTVYRPVAETVVQFVDREGEDVMYKSIALRKACCGIRK
ncbi:MAG: phosphoadenosine phosphosulfate reductase family protein, partial [Burkholderiaceae bacterium]